MSDNNNNSDIKYFKAFIRVVKSIGNDQYTHFGSVNVIEERLIYATSKDNVKQILLEKYPQFFTNCKIYSKETKDEAQFFYVVIFELYQHEINQITSDTSWKCELCNQHYSNTYLHYPKTYEKLFGKDIKFCNYENGGKDNCLTKYIDQINDYKNGNELPNDLNYVKTDSVNYIYKITEKFTNKCYIGKTRNAPFFRWWNHLTHSISPFGIYLRNNTKLSDWIFEVLIELPANISNSEIMRIESNYIREYNSIDNGYNTLISNKSI